MRVRKKKWAETAIQESNICLTTAEAAKNRGKWREFLQRQKIYLEIGCGKGKFITCLARTQENIGLIGMDSEINALCFAVKKSEEQRRTAESAAPLNLIYGTAEHLEQIFAPDEVARIYLNFSTPWPKRAHHKRRLTYPEFLASYLRILAVGGEIYLKTDNYDFFNASKIYLQYMGFTLTFAKENISKEEDVTGISTEYEEKFRQDGLAIYQLIARKGEEAEIRRLQAYYQAPDSPLRQEEEINRDLQNCEIFRSRASAYHQNKKDEEENGRLQEN